MSFRPPKRPTPDLSDPPWWASDTVLFPAVSCLKWFRKRLSSTRQTTRTRHLIYHLQLVFIFQTGQPFGLSESRRTAKIKCSHHIGFGRGCLEVLFKFNFHSILQNGLQIMEAIHTGPWKDADCYRSDSMSFGGFIGHNCPSHLPAEAFPTPTIRKRFSCLFLLFLPILIS